MFETIPNAIAHFAQGGMLLVMDNEDRENEGDLILAAQFATASSLAFIIRYTTGIICAPLLPDLADRLELPPMTSKNTDPKCTAFTVTCDALEGVTTGVSAADRAQTLLKLADPKSRASDFCRPGHIFPLRSKVGGVLERQGHTETAVDLCRLAGLVPVGVIGELMNVEDGTMLRLDGCAEFSKTYNIPLITVEALRQYRLQQLNAIPQPIGDDTVELLAECDLPVQRGGKQLGIWSQKIFESKQTGHKHVVLVKGEVSGPTPVLVRVHSECFTGDVLGSMRCDCGEQLGLSLQNIASEGKGVVIYVSGHEGRGIGLVNKVHAYRIQAEQKYDTYEANQVLGFPADMRSYASVIAIFKALGISQVELLTNNPLKVKELQPFVIRTRPLKLPANEYNARYLGCKERMELELSKDLTVPVSPAAIPMCSPLTISSPTTTTTTWQAFRTDLPDCDTGLPSQDSAASLRIAIVKAQWNGKLVQKLWKGVSQSLNDMGIQESNLTEVSVPGAFELPLAARLVANKGEVDAILCLAVLVQRERSDKMHLEGVSPAILQGMMKVQLDSMIPVLCGVLSCENEEQALDYVNNPSEIPHSLAISAVKMADLRRCTMKL